MDHGLNPAYVEAVVKGAQAVNPKIPNEAVPFYWSIDCDHYEDFEDDDGLMSADELQDYIEEGKCAIKLPRGYMCVGLHHEDQKFYVVMDLTDMPSPTLDNAESTAGEVTA